MYAYKGKVSFYNMHLMLYCIYVRSPDHNLLFIFGDHVYMYLDNYMYIGHVVYMDFVSLDSIKKSTLTALIKLLDLLTIL